MIAGAARSKETSTRCPTAPAVVKRSVGNAEGAADNVCDGYKLGRRGRCTYKTCVGDGNVVGGFDLGADDAAASVGARRVAGAVVAAAAWFFVAA